jgi:hypothetical protein
MNTAMSRLPELRIAVVNFGSGGIVTDSAERWESVMRWDTTISVLRDWQPHIVLCQEISAGAPGGIRAHLWVTANTLNMVPLLGPPSVGSTAGNHSAVLVTASAGLVIEDAHPAWSSDPGAPPAWCDALVQVPGWAQPLAELTGAGEPAIAGGNWNSYSRADPVMAVALEAAPFHLRLPGCGTPLRTGPSLRITTSTTCWRASVWRTSPARRLRLAIQERPAPADEWTTSI